MSQEDIAEKVGASFSRVNAWINLKSQPRAVFRTALEELLKASTAGAYVGDRRTRSAVARLHVLYGSPSLSSTKNALDELFYQLLALKTAHQDSKEAYLAFRAAFHPWEKLLDHEAQDIDRLLRGAGLGSVKARAFVDIARRLSTDFGRVTLAPLKRLSKPDAEAYLLSLPGVGVKTARAVLMYSLGHASLPIDSHTYRVGVRLGLVETSKGTGDVHRQFDEVVDEKLAYSLHSNFVEHGRDVCRDPEPECGRCVLSDICAKNRVETSARVSAIHKITLPEKWSDDPVAVDIYAGCGGLSAGLVDAGFDVRYALDWDKNACATHERNFPDTTVECQDIRNVTGSHIKRLVGSRIDLVAGGPNCQGLSQRGLRNPDDPRNFMLPEFVRTVSELRPRAFIMENVPGLAHRHNFGLLRSIFQMFEDLGYNCAADVLLAADYGVPQLRFRFFLVGVLESLPLTFPAPTHSPSASDELFNRRYVTVWDAIGDLPKVSVKDERSSVLNYSAPADNDFRKFARERSSGVVNHYCSATAPINIARASHISEGGNWKEIPPELLPPRLFTCRMTDHSTTYARLRRDQPAFTITSLFGNITAGAFTHPLETRALTVREGARLQSFQDHFHFAGAQNSQYRQIGNAVPPLLGRAVGSHILSLLKGQRVPGMTPRITSELLSDERAWDALPVLTPRFKALFGSGTRWPKGWGPEPHSLRDKLDNNYSLRSEFVPRSAYPVRKKSSSAVAGAQD